MSWVVPPGRAIYRVVVDAPAAYTIAFISKREFQLGSESRIFRLLSGCSARFSTHATAVVRTIKTLISNEPADASALLLKLGQQHSSKVGLDSVALRIFYDALLASVRSMLMTQWTERCPIEGSNDLLTVGDGKKMMLRVRPYVFA